MSLEGLLHAGRPDRGCLEKFADGCNSIGRAFWMGRSVKLLKNGDDYTLKAQGTAKTVTSEWVNVALLLFGVYSIGVLLTPTAMIAYGLTCIPVSFITGLGMLVKKIAIATDEHAKRYQDVAQNSAAFLKNDSKLKELNEQKARQECDLKQATHSLTGINKIINSFNEINAVNPSNSTNRYGIAYLSNLQERQESYSKQIESGTAQIQSLKNRIDQANAKKDPLERRLIAATKNYLQHKNETFKTIVIDASIEIKDPYAVADVC